MPECHHAGAAPDRDGMAIAWRASRTPVRCPSNTWRRTPSTTWRAHSESRSVYESLLQWCSVYEAEERPTSPLGKAVRYLRNHRQALMRFLEDGRIPIDNGAVERLHIRAALTRKAFLFAGSDEGGRRAAIAYTLLGCCRLAGVNPLEYLGDVLPKLLRGVTPDEADALLPDTWRDQPSVAHAATPHAV